MNKNKSVPPIGTFSLSPTLSYKDYCVSDDGVTHINVWSRGQTDLGQYLSHFSNIPFEHPEFGRFASREGFWHWLRNGMVDDELRNLHGIAAKRRGQEGRGEFQYVPNFSEEIISATYLTLLQHPSIAKLFLASSLPFTHYYVMPDNENGGKLVKEGSGAKWQCDGLEELRAEMQANMIPQIWQRRQRHYRQAREAQARQELHALSFENAQQRPTRSAQTPQLLRKQS